MEQTYASHKQTENAAPEKEAKQLQGPSMAALRSGAAMPTPNQKGHQVSLPDAMRAKMENAFGADLSAVKLYESQTVADAGANAITQGSEIAFAPGMLDFTSYGGQARLGHEISHVVSQARGEVTGGGFLNDHALESRADREGAMAAAGQQIAMPTAALSPVTAATAAGPMQAEGKDKVKDQVEPQTAWVLPTGDPEQDKPEDPMENEKFWHSTDPRSQAPKNDIIREKIMQHDQRLNQLEQSIGEQSQMINQVQQDSQMQQMQSMMQNMVMQHMWNETGMNMKPLNPYGAMGASEEDLQGSGAMNPGGMDLNDAVSEDDLKKSKT